MGDECVVDLFGDAKGNGYSADNLQNIFSSGKPVAAILMGIMLSEGRFEYTDLVTKHWPEFG